MDNGRSLESIALRDDKKPAIISRGDKMSDKGYSRVTIKVRDSWNFRDVVKEAADMAGESVNGFMIKAIRDAVQKIGVNFPEEILDERHE